MALSTGASLTLLIVIVNVWTADVLTLGATLLPVSVSFTSRLTTPNPLGARVKVRIPAGSIAGGVVNSAALPLVIDALKVTVWPAVTSSAGPGLMAVAQPV